MQISNLSLGRGSLPSEGCPYFSGNAPGVPLSHPLPAAAQGDVSDLGRGPAQYLSLLSNSQGEESLEHTLGSHRAACAQSLL